MLILEFVDGVTLRQYAEKKVKEVTACHICLQLCRALLEVHKAGYVHRDLKLENVLMVGHMAKLIDFGFAEPINRHSLLSG